jgi:hypothetical protein
MRLVPSIVKIGPPKFCGLLNEIAPHPNIQKLRQNNGACEGTGRDIISVLSECGSSLHRGYDKPGHLA